MADIKISALTAATDLTDADEFVVNDGGTSKKITPLLMERFHTKAVATQVNNSTTTAATITELDMTLPAGTYVFQYFIRYQSAATTTGVKFDVNHSGTVTAFVWNQRWSDLSATASTAVPDQNAIGAAGHVMGTFASRAKGTAGRGVTLSVDTINADMLMIIEGLCIVTVSGDLQLYHGSEVAAQSSVMPGTALIVRQVA